MKKGDKLAVSIEGTAVGYAEIVTIGDETVELLIPAQKVVARKRVQVDLTPEVKEPESQTLVTGVDRVESGTITAESVQEGVLAAENKPVEESPTQSAESAPAPDTESAVEPSEGVEEVSGG